MERRAAVLPSDDFLPVWSESFTLPVCDFYLRVQQLISWYLDGNTNILKQIPDSNMRLIELTTADIHLTEWWRQN